MSDFKLLDFGSKGDAKGPGGIRWAYILMGGAIIVGIIAWRMKATPQKAEVVSTDTTGDVDNFPAYPSISPVIPMTAPSTDTTSTITTNDGWLSAGVKYLIGKGYTAGEAQKALTVYLDGGDLTYDQGIMRDMVVVAQGIPPAPPSMGTTSDAPPRSQGAIPRQHIVKSPTETTASALAQLYYGSSGSANVISAANNGRTVFSVGDSVFIPTPDTNPTLTAYRSIVEEDYQRLLGRATDTEGLNFWVNKLQTGSSNAQVEKGIMESAEYKAKHPS